MVLLLPLIMAGNGTAAAAAKKGIASSKDGAGNGTTAAAAAKKGIASSKDGLLLLPKKAGKGSVVAPPKRHT
jgi:hypothetical protein